MWLWMFNEALRYFLMNGLRPETKMRLQIWTFKKENAFTTLTEATAQLSWFVQHFIIAPWSLSFTNKLFPQSSNTKSAKLGRVPASVYTLTNLWHRVRQRSPRCLAPGACSLHLQISRQRNETLLWIYLAYPSDGKPAQRGVEEPRRWWGELLASHVVDTAANLSLVCVCGCCASWGVYQHGAWEGAAQWREPDSCVTYNLCWHDSNLKIYTEISVEDDFCSCFPHASTIFPWHAYKRCDV